ncbi:MAG: outer membrane protein assembly factor BamD [Deltaproteobacteria bacterium]|nr:outer membrane protein assembly factor BamD [Deltaproteobacteria bacterium]
MMKMTHIKKILKCLLVFASLVAFFFCSGCSTAKKKDIYERTPADLLAEGQEKLDRAEFKSATTLLQAIKDRYPYSKESIIAELKLADSLFKRKEYDSALENYNEFERLHPKDKDIPYILYQKGMCHFNQIKSMDREQTQVTLARDEFEGLVKRFPDNEYSLKAREKIRQCLVYQAEYELYVGIFYFRTKRYLPALNRFTSLIEKYPDTGQYREALEYIARCKVKLAEADK